MDASQVTQGLGLGAFGAAVYGLAHWVVCDDARIRKVAEARWGLDRHQRKVRGGNMSQEEWFVRYARSQRLVVKWVFTPVVLLWLAVCVVTTVRGLRAS